MSDSAYGMELTIAAQDAEIKRLHAAKDAALKKMEAKRAQVSSYRENIVGEDAVAKHARAIASGRIDQLVMDIGIVRLAFEKTTAPSSAEHT